MISGFCSNWPGRRRWSDCRPTFDKVEGSNQWNPNLGKKDVPSGMLQHVETSEETAERMGKS